MRRKQKQNRNQKTYNPKTKKDNKKHKKKRERWRRIRSRDANQKTNTTNKNTKKLNRTMRNSSTHCTTKIQSLKLYKGTCCQEVKRQEKWNNFPLCTWRWMGKEVQWNEKYFGTIWLPLLRRSISDPPVQQLRFRPRHFGTTFSVVSAKIGRFGKTRSFWKIQARHRKHKNEDGFWPFFQNPHFELRVPIWRAEM